MINDSTCVDCPLNFYSLKSNSTKCLKCPFGATCSGGKNINLNKGYWRYNTESDIILECKQQEII